MASVENFPEKGLFNGERLLNQPLGLPVPLSQSGTGVAPQAEYRWVSSVLGPKWPDLRPLPHPTSSGVPGRQAGFSRPQPSWTIFGPRRSDHFLIGKKAHFYRLNSWVRSRQLATPSPLYIGSSTLPCNTGFDINFSRGLIFTKLGI